MNSGCRGYKGGTNIRGVDAIIDKAEARMAWYARTYPWKAKTDGPKQYVTVVYKWWHDHELTEELKLRLLSKCDPVVKPLLMKKLGY